MAEFEHKFLVNSKRRVFNAGRVSMEVCLDDKKQMIMMLKRLDRHVTQIFEKRTNQNYR